MKERGLAAVVAGAQAERGEQRGSDVPFEVMADLEHHRQEHEAAARPGLRARAPSIGVAEPRLAAEPDQIARLARDLELASRRERALRPRVRRAAGDLRERPRVERAAGDAQVVEPELALLALERIRVGEGRTPEDDDQGERGAKHRGACTQAPHQI